MAGQARLDSPTATLPRAIPAPATSPPNSPPATPAGSGLLIVGDRGDRHRLAPAGSATRRGGALSGYRQVRDSVFAFSSRLRPQAAPDTGVTLVLQLTGHGAYTLAIHDGSCRVTPGAARDADVVVVTDPTTWMDIVSGRQDGLRAYTRGALRARGDLNMAVGLESFFRPGPESTRAVRLRRTRTAGVEVASLVAGRGADVVLLHGIVSSKLSFLHLFDGLADRYRVHALDLPGFGHSSKPLPSGRRYSPAWMADVIAGYLQARGIRHAYVVGNSMGGRIAVELGLRHPDPIRGIIALGSAVAFDEYRWLAPGLRVVQSQWLGFAPLVPSKGRLEARLRGVFADPHRLPEAEIAAAAENLLRTARDPRNRLANAACMRHLATERSTGPRSFWHRLQALDVPSYWVWGDQDRVVSHRYAQRVRACLPGARVEVWEGVGHLPQVEDPQRTAAAVESFLGDVDLVTAPIASTHR